MFIIASYALAQIHMNYHWFHSIEVFLGAKQWTNLEYNGTDWVCGSGLVHPISVVGANLPICYGLQKKN